MYWYNTRARGEQQKTATDNTGSVDLIPAAAEEEEVGVRASYDGGWWASGDARQLFAPCKKVEDKECDVKEIIMEHIEMLEAVNRLPSNWKTVNDTKVPAALSIAAPNCIPILKQLPSCFGTEACILLWH